MKGLRPAKKSFFLRKKGASGGWAEPHLLAFTGRKGSFENPPGVLMAAGSVKTKEKGTLEGSLCIKYII